MSRFRHVILATALFAGLTVLHTWPIAGNPAGVLAHGLVVEVFSGCLRCFIAG